MHSAVLGRIGGRQRVLLSDLERQLAHIKGQLLGRPCVKIRNKLRDVALDQRDVLHVHRAVAVHIGSFCVDGLSRFRQPALDLGRVHHVHRAVSVDVTDYGCRLLCGKRGGAACGQKDCHQNSCYFFHSKTHFLSKSKYVLSLFGVMFNTYCAKTKINIIQKGQARRLLT